MSRFNKYFLVYFIEEADFHDKEDNYTIQVTKEKVTVIQPHLNRHDVSGHHLRLKNIIDIIIEEQQIKKFISWYYSPMALLFTAHLESSLVVYDCMDELSAFKFAPPELKEAEQKLFQTADVVFTGGHNLYKAKKHLHRNIFPFPSSIEKEHFFRARHAIAEPEEQQHIPHPRLGFFGVLDERFDIDLIKKVADAKPEWQFVFIGPIVKISCDSLPKNSNIHYFGSKKYTELPDYVSGWDIALIPFALNESTKYISPTKTPEYLAAGKPVISTSIEDVVHPYSDKQLVHIIHSAEEFIDAASKELSTTSKDAWLKNADTFLADISWNKTWQEMFDIIKSTLNLKNPKKQKNLKAYV
jgi:UDP-galactopyranose mutase